MTANISNLSQFKYFSTTNKVKNMPKTISIEITTLCPLQCEYCGRPQGLGRNMTYEEFTRLKENIESINGLERVVLCGIGESFLHKDIYKIIHELREYKISIVTSGTIKIDYKQLVLHRNVDTIIFSVDATSESRIKAICGQSYSYENLKENLDNIKTMKKESLRKIGNIQLVLNCTVNEKNIDEIPRIMDFAKQNGFGHVHYSIAWEEYDFVMSNLKLLQNSFLIAYNKAHLYNITIYDPFNFFCCFSGNSVLPFINIEGEIFPCGYGLKTQYTAGNILKKKFPQIWEDQKYDKFKSGQICRECCVVKMHSLVKERGFGYAK